jgi:hypothetical protein
MDQGREYKDVKVFRFTVGFFPKDEVVEVRAEPSPVPVFGDHKLLGFATIENQKHIALAHIAIDPACPERLDIELKARAYWLDANIECRGIMSKAIFQTGGVRPALVPTVIYVKALHLTGEPIPYHDPIDATGWGME